MKRVCCVKSRRSFASQTRVERSIRWVRQGEIGKITLIGRVCKEGRRWERYWEKRLRNARKRKNLTSKVYTLRETERESKVKDQFLSGGQRRKQSNKTREDGKLQRAGEQTRDRELHKWRIIENLDWRRGKCIRMARFCLANCTIGLGS